MRPHKLEQLQFDLALYPRCEPDGEHVANMRRAMQVGVTFPPLVICRKTRKVADGFHRGRAYISLFGENHEVECVEKDYASDQELFKDAMRLNAGHGKTLSAADRQHCIQRAAKLGIDDRSIASCLSVDPGYVGGLRVDVAVSPVQRMLPVGRPANGRTKRPEPPPKPTIHKSEARPETGARPSYGYMIGTLLGALRNGGIDCSDERTSRQLRELAELIDEKVRCVAAH